MAKVRVIEDKILVKVSRDEKVTSSGIILPDTSGEERKYEGVVVEVGTHPEIEKSGIKVGTYVFYEKGTNYELEIDGVLHDSVSVFDVVAIGEEE